MTTFQQRLRDEMVRRNYSPTTIRSYLHALRTCERYHRRRRIDRLGPDALRGYHAHLFTEKKLAVNWDDELVKATLLTRDGAVVHPNFQPKAA